MFFLSVPFYTLYSFHIFYSFVVYPSLIGFFHSLLFPCAYIMPIFYLNLKLNNITNININLWGNLNTKYTVTPTSGRPWANTGVKNFQRNFEIQTDHLISARRPDLKKEYLVCLRNILWSQNVQLLKKKCFASRLLLVYLLLNKKKNKIKIL